MFLIFWKSEPQPSDKHGSYKEGVYNLSRAREPLTFDSYGRLAHNQIRGFIVSILHTVNNNVTFNVTVIYVV
jgi:hypothetical protein